MDSLSPATSVPALGSLLSSASTKSQSSLPVFPRSDESHGEGASCISTNGPCISTTGQLMRLLFTMAPNQTVALCGNSTLSTTIPIVLRQANTTICYSGTPDEPCKLQSTGTSEILIITGAHSTLRGITFENGRSDGSGGNVVIDAVGSHNIIDCTFNNGTASRYGGNLFVQNSDLLLISGSVFSGGYAPFGGGGMTIVNTTFLKTRSTVYVNNSAGNSSLAVTGGGGVFVSHDLHTRAGHASVYIQTTTFTNNTAVSGFGGGFLLTTNNGRMPSLMIEKSTFIGNGAQMSGGAGAVIFASPSFTYDIRWSSNIGFDNHRFNVFSAYQCRDFAIIVNGEKCLNFTSDVVYPPK